MPSVSDFDEEFENMITELLPIYNNNRSKVIRNGIKCLYDTEIAKARQNAMMDIVQATTLFLMGCGLVAFALSMFFNIPLLMSFAVILLFISGLFIMMLTFVNNRKIKVERSDAA